MAPLDERLERLYRESPKLQARYIEEVLGLHDERAELVSKITGGISRPEAALLCDIVREIRPIRSLEVGLGYGFSAMAICTASDAAAEGREHIIIDPHQSSYWGNLGLGHLADAGFGPIVRHYEDYSYRVLPELEKAGMKVDLAFIDGWHTFDYVFVDFFYIDKMLRQGGAVVFDDADWPSIRPVLRYIVTNLPYSVARTLPEKAERAPIDVKLGLEGSCIALRKEKAESNREIFYHRNWME